MCTPTLRDSTPITTNSDILFEHMEEVERLEERISLLESPKGALEVLSKAMQSDYDYAWSWHCNVAVSAIDAGAPHKEANERAADFMFRAFGVRTDHSPLQEQEK
jgi:hypothetical protein